MMTLSITGKLKHFSRLLSILTVPTIQTMTSSKPTFNFSQRDEFIKNSLELEKTPYYDHYRNIMCLKPVTTGTFQAQPFKTAITALESVATINQADIHEADFNQCVLPKGHSGKCVKRLPLFNKRDLAKKLTTSVDNCIYSTPGNDDYVYKNRASRLFPIQLTNAQEKQVRNKQGDKLKCAIPLKDASTSFLLATAYLDYITFVLSIHDIATVLDKVKQEQFADYIQSHKEFLAQHYATYSRSVFTTNGETICAVTKKVVSIIDFADVERDARIDIRDEDIQMGHIETRSETRSSIRGGNLVFMSRRGNLIIGERNFLEDAWKEELRAICHDDISTHTVSHANLMRPITPPPRIVFTTVQDAVLNMSQADQAELLRWLLAKQQQT